MRYILQLYIINKNENSINWDTINVKLDFNNDNENNPDNIKYLGYINQKRATSANKFLGVFIDPQLNFKYHINFLKKIFHIVCISQTELNIFYVMMYY